MVGAGLGVREGTEGRGGVPQGVEVAAAQGDGNYKTRWCRRTGLCLPQALRLPAT